MSAPEPQPNLQAFIELLDKLMSQFDACSQQITEIEWMPDSQALATKLRLMKLDVKRASSSLQEMINSLANEAQSRDDADEGPSGKQP